MIGQTRVDIRQENLAVARDGFGLLAGRAFRGSAQLGELNRRDVGGELSIGGQCPSEEKEQIPWLGHLAPDQGIENIHGQDAVAPIGKAVAKQDQTAVAYLGRRW